MKSNDMIKFRESFKMSRSELAELLGVTAPAVTFWETGQRKIPGPVEKIIKFIKRFPQYKGEI